MLTVGVIVGLTLLISGAFGLYGGHLAARRRGRMPIQAVVVLGVLALAWPGSWITAGPPFAFWAGYGVGLGILRRSNRARRLIIQEFRQALGNGEVALHYQPIIDLDSDLMVGVEALVRWRHPDGLRMPGEFLHVLSDKETARRFALWQIDAAIEDAARWPGLRVSLNATPEYLISPDAGLNLLNAIRATGLRPEQFTIEVIEWAIIKQEETAREMLTMLKRAGVKIALDDFGSGYASAKYLSMFPFDYVKIDRAFIVEMSQGRSGYVEALALMAQRLGIESLAEGVETEAEVAAARALGCTMAQGFLYDKALPPDGIDERLARQPA